MKRRQVTRWHAVGGRENGIIPSTQDSERALACRRAR